MQAKVYDWKQIKLLTTLSATQHLSESGFEWEVLQALLHFLGGQRHANSPKKAEL